MRITVSALCLFGCLAGCSDVVKHNEQLTSTVDVVGDPADPVPASQEPGDIFGSGTIPVDDTEQVTLIPTSADVAVNDETMEETIVTARPNALKSDSDVRPARLNTATRDTDVPQ